MAANLSESDLDDLIGLTSGDKMRKLVDQFHKEELSSKKLDTMYDEIKKMDKFSSLEEQLGYYKLKIVELGEFVALISEFNHDISFLGPEDICRQLSTRVDKTSTEKRGYEPKLVALRKEVILMIHNCSEQVNRKALLSYGLLIKELGQMKVFLEKKYSEVNEKQSIQTIEKRRKELLRMYISLRDKMPVMV